eukprot:350136-Chlamydomonas_euryale.AAC.19
MHKGKGGSLQALPSKGGEACRLRQAVCVQGRRGWQAPPSKGGGGRGLQAPPSSVCRGRRGLQAPPNARGGGGEVKGLASSTTNV